MAKGRMSKATKKRLIFFGIPSIIIICYFVFNLFYSSFKLYNLNREGKKLDSDLVELKRQSKILNAEIDKLKDPEYIAKFARENFAYSKNGEYIIKIPTEEKKYEEEKLDINIDYNYIIYGGIGLLIIIFIYVIKKKK